MMAFLGILQKVTFGADLRALTSFDSWQCQVAKELKAAKLIFFTRGHVADLRAVSNAASVFCIIAVAYVAQVGHIASGSGAHTRGGLLRTCSRRIRQVVWTKWAVLNS